jgi:hypothetical protein
MNLQNFVTESIVQIVRGIEAANDALKDSTAVVSPKNVVPIDTERSHVFGYLIEPDSQGQYRTSVQRIDFDVAVYAEEGTETKGGIGLMVGTIGLGSQGKSDKSHSSESRIKFAVPIILPALK